jgi:hypothetical protein
LSAASPISWYFWLFELPALLSFDTVSAFATSPENLPPFVRENRLLKNALLSVEFAPLYATSVDDTTPIAPPPVRATSFSPRLGNAGSLNRPTSHDAAMNSGSLSGFTSVLASVSRNTLSSASFTGLPWPT